MLHIRGKPRTALSPMGYWWVPLRSNPPYIGNAIIMFHPFHA